MEHKSVAPEDSQRVKCGLCSKDSHYCERDTAPPQLQGSIRSMAVLRDREKGVSEFMIERIVSHCLSICRKRSSPQSITGGIVSRCPKIDEPETVKYSSWIHRSLELPS